jgi:superfamily II DNA or RNA helicase
MSLEDWQIELRRQFGREQNFQIRNAGDHPVFSTFDVTNPDSRNTYRVRIRGRHLGDNFCTCPDFTTNTLGTCKHIEFTLAWIERRRGGKKALREGFQPPYSEIYLQYGARRDVCFRPGAECPRPVARLAGEYFDDDGKLLPEAFGKFETFLSEADKHDHEIHHHEDVLAFIAEVRDAEHRRRQVAEAFPAAGRSAGFKDLLKVDLYGYQREGVLFAARAGRCLIGDDMGLGKTVQALATTEVMARLLGVERALIVCPTSLKHQWQREIERCTGRNAQVIGGLKPRRARQFAEENFYKITNYDTIHADLDAIDNWAPDLVILDEAQRIKNWTTRTARSVKKISAPYAIVLTGTPLENRLEELVSIVQFVDRYRLGPTFRLLHEHQIRDEVGKVVGYKGLDQIGKTLEPILVRRHKDQVLDQLPERIDNTFFVPMTDLQRTYHTENLEIVARVVAKWRKYKFLSESDQRKLMIALQRMRMACDSSYLVDHRTDQGRKADEAITLLSEVLEEPQTKVVVFSQWLRMHELLARRLEDKPWDHVLFHGGVASGKRKDLIDRFHDDPNCRVFLSTDTGGTGLNLQHASVVLNMDLPWNPAVLEQRIGRVHRLGQKQPVRVVNFVAQGTIEDGMQHLLHFKKSLFAGVLDGGEKDVFMGGSRFNRFMETVEEATNAIPEAMLEDAEEALRRPPDEGEEDIPLPPPSSGNGQPAGSRGRRGGSGSSRPGSGAGPGGGGMIPPGFEEEPAPPPPPSAPPDPWTGLLQSGLAILQQLASRNSQSDSNGSSGSRSSGGFGSFLQRDDKTGETYLKVPIPPPEAIDQAVQVIGKLFQSFSR